MKSGNRLGALQHFNHALSIDEKCVDALVARGAAYVILETFENSYIFSATQMMVISPRQRRISTKRCPFSQIIKMQKSTWSRRSSVMPICKLEKMLICLLKREVNL